MQQRRQLWTERLQLVRLGFSIELLVLQDLIFRCGVDANLILVALRLQLVLFRQLGDPILQASDRRPGVANPSSCHARDVADFTMSVARPLICFNTREEWPKRLYGATCFILRFDAGLIGITANHVIEAFEKRSREEGQFVYLLRTGPIDLIAAVIDRNAELDIATFRVTEDQLIGSKAIAIDCRTEWPPPTPDRGAALSLGGYPEKLKKSSMQSDVEFRAYVNMCFAEDVSNNDILVTYEPGRDFRALAAAEFPDVGADLSGCSGGPVLMHVERKGWLRWFAVGIIIASLGMAEFDLIRIRRINAVRRDGMIVP